MDFDTGFTAMAYALFTGTGTDDPTTCLAPANFTVGELDSKKTGELRMLVDLSASSFNANALTTTLMDAAVNGSEVLRNGTKLRMIVATEGAGNSIEFTDPIMNIDLNFAATKGEYLELTFDTNNGTERWIW